MSYELIKEAIQKIDEATAWKTLLIEYDHKRHPNEYTCYAIHFEDHATLATLIRTMANTFLGIIDRWNGVVDPYSGMGQQSSVAKLSTDSPLVKECWGVLLQHINQYDDNTPIEMVKASAYIFVGTYTDRTGSDKNFYFLTRKNPVLSAKRKSKLLSVRQNTIITINDPLVQFNKCFDALIYKNTIYMINANCESIFNMEYTHKKICSSCLDTLEQINIIKDMDDYRTYALSGQTPKKFITYDSDIVSKLQVTEDQQLLAQEFRIPYDEALHQFDLSSPQNAKVFTSIICGKAKANLLNGGYCEVPSSIPLSLS